MYNDVRMKRDTNIQTYKHVFLSSSGIVYTPCEDCHTLKRASLLELCKVQVGHAFAKVGGARIPKKGGRITYTRVRLIRVPRYEKQYLCVDCRTALFTQTVLKGEG